ncbi:MAG: hypothetical protein IKU88_08705 [Alistipes sp.]|nr:hypothetical protein [Alistipes sp.]
MLLSKLKAMAAKVALIGVVCAVISIAYIALSAGYGVGHIAISQQELAALQAKQYQPSQVDVIYERLSDNKQDFLHLKIDTTYHRIGKGNYTREVLCNREYSFREFDGSYNDCLNAVAHCFVEGDAERKWQSGDATKKIAGNNCYRAVTTFTDKSWEAWYTTSLPHLAEGAKAKDLFEGLILEARDAEGEYELKAKYITQYIG